MIFRLLAAAAAVMIASAAPAANERGPQRHPAAPAAEDAQAARVIVKYRADSRLMRALAVAPRGAPSAAASAAPSATATARPQHAASLAARLSLPLVDGPVLGGRTQALRSVGLSSSQLAARLAAQPDVEWAVPDLRRRLTAVPNDPYFGAGQASITPSAGQWYLRAPDSTFVSAVNAVGAWDVTPGSPSITVAVLDTGVRPNHPDLVGKLHPGRDFIVDRVTANDGGGRDPDPSDPGDWTDFGECSGGEAAQPSSWHGTQVAGLVGAATDNAVGMAGAGRNVMVLPVRVLGRCGGYDSDIIAGMRWAAGLSSDPVFNLHPARVVNLSLGSPGACLASYADAVAELAAAGVTVVAAVGNDTGTAVGVPANCPGAIAVAGVRHSGTKVGYSSLGPESAIAAPAGNCVNLTGACLYPLLTTTNSGSTAPGADTYSDSNDATLGTSFASPIVAGTVALMLSANPSLTPAQVRTALQATARPFPSTGAEPDVVTCRAPDATEQIECYCTIGTCGAGLLDAAAAVAMSTPAAMADAAASDRVFNHLEALYPQYIAPAAQRSVVNYGYYHRYYPSTRSYVGTAGGNVYYLVPALNDRINLLGRLADLLAQAAAAGY